MIEAHGGWARLDRVRAYRLEGDLFSMRHHDDMPTVRVFQRPDRLKILVRYPEGPEARVCDGTRGWRAVHGEPFEASTGPMLEAMRLQAARSDLPWLLHEHAAAVRTIEPYEHEGVRLPGVEIPLDDGLVVRAYADPKTWRLRMSQGILPHHGAETHFETFYEEWRAVDGVWFPVRERNWASGVQTGITKIDSVIVNPPLEKNAFAPLEFGKPEAKKPGKRGGS